MERKEKKVRSMNDLRKRLKERVSRALNQSKEVRDEIRILGNDPAMVEEVDHAERFIEALIAELERIGKRVQSEAALDPECLAGRHDDCQKSAQASYCTCIGHEPKNKEN